MVLRLLVDLSAVGNARADALRRVVDDVRHAPVTGPGAPMILVAFSLFHPAGRGSSQRQDLPVDAG
jgi:hypothetical protein